MLEKYEMLVFASKQKNSVPDKFLIVFFQCPLYYKVFLHVLKCWQTWTSLARSVHQAKQVLTVISVGYV